MAMNGTEEISRCAATLYHYNGYCFNRSRIPEGQIAIREEECAALDKKEEPVSMIIR